MDHERLLDDAAAHYVLIKQEHPDLSSEEMVTLIADRVALDAELRMAIADHAPGTDEGWSTIQRFVHAVEYFDDQGDQSPR